MFIIILVYLELQLTPRSRVHARFSHYNSCDDVAVVKIDNMHAIVKIILIMQKYASCKYYNFPTNFSHELVLYLRFFIIIQAKRFRESDIFMQTSVECVMLVTYLIRQKYVLSALIRFGIDQPRLLYVSRLIWNHLDFSVHAFSSSNSSDNRVLLEGVIYL